MTQQTTIDPAPNRLVAVYGTLKQGYMRHASLMPVAKKGNMWIKDHIMVHWGQYPAIIPFEGFDSLAEIYEVSADRMPVLDSIEGVSTGLYHRKTITTPWGKAEVYFQPAERLKEGHQIISSGVWLGASSPTQKWLGFATETDLLKRQPPACRVLSLRHPSGDLDVMTINSLRKQAALPVPQGTTMPVVYSSTPRDTVYTPPPAPPTYPIIDLAADIGPGFEEV